MKIVSRRQKNSASGHIQRGGKLEKLSAISIGCANKERDRKRKPIPSSSLDLRNASTQLIPNDTGERTEESRGSFPRLHSPTNPSSYRLILRRSRPASPRTPEPNITSVPGSGTVSYT